jgi:uroporphyrinogen-III synthase
MKEVPFADNPEAFQFAEKLLDGEVQGVLFLTGVGARYLLETLEARYQREVILEALRGAFIIVRGPKPLRVMNEWKVPVSIAVPEPNTWRDILKAVDERGGAALRGKMLALQEYGIRNEPLIQGLEERGVRVLRVPVYRWALPDDIAPLQDALRRIVEKRADIALFTSATQADHVMKVAEGMGMKDRVREAFQGIIVASIGPICSEALRAHGIRVDFEPKTPKMGPLVAGLADNIETLRADKR